MNRTNRMARCSRVGLAALALLLASAVTARPGQAQAPPHTVYLPAALRSGALGEGPPPPADRTGTWTAYTDGDYVNDLAVDPTTGDVWAGTAGGAVKWDPRTGTSTRYTQQDGLAATRVDHVTVDAAGNRWFFFDGDPDGPSSERRPAVISQLDRGGAWRTFPVPAGIPADRVISMAARADGALWLGGQHVRRRDPDGAWQVVPGAGCGWISAIAVDASGSPWFASDCGARRLGPDGEWQSWLEGDRVATMALVDGGPEAWFGSGVIAHHLRADGTFEPMLVSDPAPATPIRAIAAPADGSVWIAMGSGLARRGPDGAWRTWTEADGFPTCTRMAEW